MTESDEERQRNKMKNILKPKGQNAKKNQKKLVEKAKEEIKIEKEEIKKVEEPTSSTNQNQENNDRLINNYIKENSAKSPESPKQEVILEKNNIVSEPYKPIEDSSQQFNYEEYTNNYENPSNNIEINNDHRVENLSIYSKKEEPEENEYDKELYALIEKKDYDTFFNECYNVIKANEQLKEYRSFLSYFYKFLTKLQIETSNFINDKKLKGPSIKDINVLKSENPDIPLKNLNQLVENNYVIFKEYYIDTSHPQTFLSIYFFMMCDKGIINFENVNFYLLLFDQFPWYKLDKIKDLDEQFFTNLKSIEKYCSQKPKNYKYSAFEKFNSTKPFSVQSKSLDFNIASTIMRCYFLNILIELANNNISESNDLELLSYESTTVVEVIHAMVNENYLTHDILQKFFISKQFDFYNNFIEIDIKDKAFDFNKILSSNLDDPNSSIINYYSILNNNKVITLLKADEIQAPVKQYKPFEIIPFYKTALENLTILTDNMSNFLEEYWNKYYDFFLNFPDINPSLDENIKVKYDFLFESIKNLQKFFDENFNIKNRQHNLPIPSFFLYDPSTTSQFELHYRNKEQEMILLINEQASYGKEQKIFKNFCKRCYSDTHKILTLSCDHEICEECIRNYISLKTYNLILIKYNQFGLMNCIKCPFEDCCSFMKKEEIYKPFSIYSKQISQNYTLVKFLFIKE